LSEAVEIVPQSPLLGLRGKASAAIERLARRPVLLLLSPVGIFLLAFFLMPFLALLRVSLAENPGGSGYGEGTLFYKPGTWTFANYVRFFSDPYFVNMAVFTVEFGVIVCIATTIVAYAFAYQIYRASAWLKSVLLMIVILPKFTNVLVLMYGLLVVFGTHGLLNRALLGVGIISQPLPMLFNLFGVVLGEVILVMPYCVLVMVATLHAIDDSLVDAAQGLGASRARAFIEVTLPLSLPGVWVSVLLSFMWGAGAFAAPYLLGTAELYPLAVEVDRQVNWRLNWAMGATIAFVLMSIVAALVIVLTYVQGKERDT
jgi:ABC-type spermidine/putrescine transport system permease subunit I